MNKITVITVKETSHMKVRIDPIPEMMSISNVPHCGYCPT
jgi:hypothetical protein